MATKIADERLNRDKKSESSDPEASIEVEEGSDEADESQYEAQENSHSINKKVQPQPDPFQDPDDFYVPKESARLSEKFKDSGLQIIVKMASIELTPEKPEFPIGGWHVS